MSIGTVITTVMNMVKQYKLENELKQAYLAKINDVNTRIINILANNFRLNAGAVRSAISQKFQEYGIDPLNFDSSLDSASKKIDQDELLQVKLMYSLLGACKLMDDAGLAMLQNTVADWLKKISYKFPKSLIIENFTMCDEKFPQTVDALKQIIYSYIAYLDKTGFGHLNWQRLSIDPYFRFLLGIEDPDEYIFTRIFQKKKLEWSFSDTQHIPLHEIIEAGTKGGDWMISAFKP